MNSSQECLKAALDMNHVLYGTRPYNQLPADLLTPSQAERETLENIERLARSEVEFRDAMEHAPEGWNRPPSDADVDEMSKLDAMKHKGAHEL